MTQIDKGEYKTLHLDCECLSEEHMVRFKPGWDNHVDIDIQLNQYANFFDRLKSGLKYIFTGVSHCGWDTVILQDKDVPKLIKFLEEQMGIKRF